MVKVFLAVWSYLKPLKVIHPTTSCYSRRKQQKQSFDLLPAFNHDWLLSPNDMKEFVFLMGHIANINVTYNLHLFITQWMSFMHLAMCQTKSGNIYNV